MSQYLQINKDNKWKKTNLSSSWYLITRAVVHTSIPISSTISTPFLFHLISSNLTLPKISVSDHTTLNPKLCLQN